MTGDTTGEISARLTAAVRAGNLAADPVQLEAARRLDQLLKTLSGLKETLKPNLFQRLRRAPRASTVRGLYLHGPVGRGKSMLMDIFFEMASFQPKRRWHFHEFMVEVHERIARGRATTDGDPIPFVAAEIASEAALLCFDELQVNDIADAMILGRLFKGLFEKGVVVVATSNAAPDHLYWNGLNRQLFLPFISLLESNLDLFELRSHRDYRLEKLGHERLYFSPLTPENRAGFEGHWARLIGQNPPYPRTLDVKGHSVQVPQACGGIARFSFPDLCEKAYGPADFLEIARTFHTVLIENVPQLGPERRNEARRFISLIDTLYDQKVCLIVTAAAEPHKLYTKGDGADHFERTASRLMEMRSEAYLLPRG